MQYMDKQMPLLKKILPIYVTLLLSNCGQPTAAPLPQSEVTVSQDSVTKRAALLQSTQPPQATIGFTASPTDTQTSQKTLAIADAQPSPTVPATEDPPNIPASEWNLTAEHDSVGPTGVSPEAILLKDGRIRLYVTSMGIEVWESADGLSFQRVQAHTPLGADPTLVRTSVGWRMYFTEMSPGGPDAGGGLIRSATSVDGLDWTLSSETGIVQETDRRAWGVPDSYVLADGRVRIIWTDTLAGKRREVLRSATSDDGIAFTVDAGLRLLGGFVDPYVLPRAPGFMLVSTSPPSGPGREPQRLFLATSEEELEWVVGDIPLLDRSPRNALDPTAILLEDGRWRVYYTLSDGPQADGFRIASAILTGPAVSAPEPTLPAPAPAQPQPTAEELDVAASTPGCEETRYTFTDLGVALTAQDAGNSDPMAPMANPSSLLLNDGRVRLFFTNARAGIGSAISVDGITFSYEGTRVSAPEAMNQGARLGPLRVHRLPDGRVRMFVGSSETGVQSFVSSDEGQSFTIEQGERITQDAADMLAIQKLSIIPLPDGRWRGYFGPAPQHGAPGSNPSSGGPPDHWLRSAISTDLLEWGVEPGVLIGPGAPHLTASVREVFPLLRDDGCVTLFYQLNKPQDAGIHDFSGVAVVGYSTSTDGLMFRKQFVLINLRDPAGPDVLHLPDGTYLMYHDSTDYVDYGHGIRVGKLEVSPP